MSSIGETVAVRVESRDEYAGWIDTLKGQAGRARILMRGERPLLLVVGGGKSSKTKTTPFEIAEHLRTPEEMAAYLDAWLEEAPDDAAGIAKALGEIARAKGMSQVARDAGLGRESLYRALSADGSPSFATVLKVARALGIKLHAEAA